MMKATILSEWIGTGAKSDAFRPLIFDLYKFESASDVTGQDTSVIIPAVNANVIEAIMDDMTYAAIEADARFVVLSSEAWNG